MYKTKVFFGSCDHNGNTADNLFNDWIEHHKDIQILEFRYQQARYGDHSIAILYKEE